MSVVRSNRRSLRSPQRGVALVVALVLLVVATLIGLASVRGTNLQERMSSNMYDRSIAFQRAESALRAAEAAITSSYQITVLGGVDCSPTAGVACPAVPGTAFSGTNANWIAVDDAHNVNPTLGPGRPEYYIQFMGTGSSDENLGLAANADYGNYGNTYPPDNVAFFRITARSSSPTQAGDRSIVVLQTTVKRAF